ncbi:TetR family transcriptional regulator [Rhodococcoides yunnanense]|uniref:TetR family transcriptional regulator n=1 Tax=Rhodococcoides yunnanense TaxID=278209 RepID=UPI000933E45D|nr:TetR family transcriptional regulator [Rhodococcus yunnanensis]
MARWKPGAKDRLHAAALELYAERGFEQTTVTDIAQAAGLTERTFFRHFTDKREVLFGGQDQLRQVFVDGVAAAPEPAPAVDVVANALQAAASYFPDERRQSSRTRQTVIDANPGLQERELLKLASLTQSIAVAVGERGVPEPQATLAAHTAVTVFGVAFVQWIEDGEQRSFGDIAHEIFEELRSLTSPPL